MLRIWIILLLFFLGCQNSFCQSADTMEHSKDEILYITSYNIDNNFSNNFIESMMERYRQQGGTYTVSIEALNAHSLEVASNNWLYNMEKILENHPKVKAVILYGMEAWVSYFSLTSEKYRQLPVICVAAQRWVAALPGSPVNSINSLGLSSFSNLDVLDIVKGFNVRACYYYDYDIQTDMKVLQDYFPQVSHLAIISDNSYAGISNRNSIHEFLQKNYPQLPVTYIDGTELDMGQASEKVQKLPLNSAIFFCMWKYDKYGASKTNYDQSIFHLITDEKNIPVLSLNGSGFGSWALGGSHPSYSWGDSRRHPADILYSVLDKHEEEEPYFYSVTNRLRMDYNVMSRFHIQVSDLPKGTLVINEPPLNFWNVWDEFKWHIITFLVGLVGISACLGITIVYNIRLRKTHRKLQQAMKDAESADRMKGMFIQSLSHEIQNPLHAIQTVNQLVLDNSLELDNETKKSMFRDIDRNLHTITDQIDKILLLTKLESEALTEHKEEVSLREVYDLALAAARPFIPESVQVDLRMPGEMVIPLVKSDVVQLLTELLANAGKFSPLNGSIFVSVMQNLERTHLTLSVTDEGKGIPPEESEHIFERFCRLDKFVPGSGLGLTIARLLAQRMGGSLSLDAAYLRGARFVLILPIYRDQKVARFKAAK